MSGSSVRHEKQHMNSNWGTLPFVSVKEPFFVSLYPSDVISPPWRREKIGALFQGYRSPSDEQMSTCRPRTHLQSCRLARSVNDSKLYLDTKQCPTKVYSGRFGRAHQSSTQLWTYKVLISAGWWLKVAEQTSLALQKLQLSEYVWNNS